MNAQQLANIRRIKRTPEYRRASPKERKALLLAGRVESNFEDVPHGDRDSEGILQQRPSQGWGPASETVEQDVAQFLERAGAINRRGHRGSAGQLAQAVQRSAFPDRYDQHSKEANRLMRGDAKGGRTKPRRIRGGPVTDEESAMIDALLDRRKRGGSLLKRYEARVATGEYTSEAPERKKTKKDYGLKGKSKSGRTIHELIYRGPGSDDSMNIKGGKVVGKGFYSKHEDHAHYAGSRDDVLAAARLARQMGLTVRELEPFDKVDPVHVKGSWHNTNQAVDVSGDPTKTAAWARRVARGDF